jgi:hypothetical protein
MTVKEAYAVHRTAVHNVGKGKGYTHRFPERLEEALVVLNRFWDYVGTATYVSHDMVEKYDKEFPS